MRSWLFLWKTAETTEDQIKVYTYDGENKNGLFKGRLNVATESIAINGKIIKDCTIDVLIRP